LTSYFLKAGIGYSISTIIAAIANASFWLLAVKFAEPSDVGLASSAFSMPVLLSTIAALSFEYPIIKYISKDKSFFGSILFFEIVIHLLLIPILLLSIQQITDNFLVVVFAVIVLLSFPLQQISSVALMGSFLIKPVNIMNVVGAVLKIIILIVFSSFHLGSLGILLALSSQFFIIGTVLLIIAFKKFGFEFKISTLKTAFLEGISNYPTKLTGVFQYFGSISILTLFAVPFEDIAGFTLSYGFLVLITAIPAGFSLLSISSLTKEKESSAVSMTWGMAIAIPIITIMFTSSDWILSIYKDIYSKYAGLLVILAISIIPLILKTNVITMLNNQGALKKIVLLGIIESVIFLSAIVFLVPSIGAIGGAWAVAISSISAAILSLYWVNNTIRRIFFTSILIVAVGVASGLLVQQIIDNRLIVTLVGFGTSTASMFLFRLIRFSEILFIINQIKSRNF